MPDLGPVYDFGRFRLDATEQVLRCGGRPVHLTLKAFAVLLVLVENSGRLVQKDELMRLCWPDAFVEEANLAQTIALIRRALGENRQHREYVETIHRRGYRFMAEVSVENGTNVLGPTTTNAHKLRRGIIDRERLKMNPGIPANPCLERHSPWYDEAQLSYLRGRYYWSKYTLEGLKSGIEYFERSLGMDPSDAEAYAGLADCHHRLSNIYLERALCRLGKQRP